MWYKNFQFQLRFYVSTEDLQILAVALAFTTRAIDDGVLKVEGKGRGSLKLFYLLSSLLFRRELDTDCTHCSIALLPTHRQRLL